MKVKIECLPKPKLAFGLGKAGLEPRRVMAKAGPVDGGRIDEIRLALVGLEGDVRAARPWISRLNNFMAAREGNSARYRDWPGAPSALGVHFIVEDRFVRPLDQARLDLATKKGLTKDGFEELLLDLFDGRIQGSLGDGSPDCIVVCLSEDIADLKIENPGLTLHERRALELLRAEEESEQLRLFCPTPDELKAAEELRTQADDLLFRTFYRALKARAQNHLNPVPVQVLRRDTGSIVPMTRGIVRQRALGILALRFTTRRADCHGARLSFRKTSASWACRFTTSINVQAVLFMRAWRKRSQRTWSRSH